MGVSRAVDFGAREMPLCRSFALLAQLVEHFHGKEGVAGSSPAEGSCKAAAYGGFLFGLMVARERETFSWAVAGPH